MSTDQIAEMSPVAGTAFISAEEYLRLERDPERTPRKTEWIDGKRRVMPGGTLYHGLLIKRIFAALLAALDEEKFELVPSDLRTRVPNGPYFYPDIVVFPVAAELEDGEHDTLKNPIVIFEVLSTSTKRIDRNVKRERYSEIPSLTDYLLVSQDSRHVEHFSRAAGSVAEFADPNVLTAADAVIGLDSVGARVPLADVYRGVID